jgi:hypothetical protein
MQTIRDYAKDKFSKVVAVRAIFSAFFKSSEYEETPQNELDTTIGMYISMLDQHDASRQVSANRGTRFGGATDDPDHEEDIVGTAGSRRPRADSPVGQGSSKKRALTSPFLHGLETNLLKKPSSPRAKNSQENGPKSHP